MSVENVYNCGKATFAAIVIIESSVNQYIRFYLILLVFKMYVNKNKTAFSAALYSNLSQLLVEIILKTLIAETVIYVFMMLFKVIVVSF